MLNRNLLAQARASRAAFALTIGFSFFGGLLTVAQAWYLSRIIGRVFLGGESLPAVSAELAIMLIVVVLRAATVMGGEVAAGHVALRVKTGLRQMLFDHLLALGPAYTQGERTGELTATIVEGVEALDAYFSQYLPQLVVAALVPLTVLAFVLPLDLLSATVLLLTAPLIPLFMILIGKAAEALTRRQYDLLSRLSAHFLDVLQGLTTLKLLGQSRAQAGTIGLIGDRYRVATMNVLRVAFLSALVLEIVATISTAIVAVEVGLRLLYGQVQFQQALFILILAPEFYLPLRMLGARFHAGTSGTSAAKRIFEILPVRADGNPLPSAHDHPPLPAHDHPPTIILHNLHYTYPGNRPALNGVSFEIHSGQKVALVGPSGAGKSTIAQLLLRFIEPTEGGITADGLPVREVPPAWWRQLIAWVPQRPHLFHDTVAANLRLARPHATAAELSRAAQAAHIHDFIQSLPRGYDTVVGEQGARLSGGQAQRLALARAFLKDAPFLLLDEPTSNIDPELEAQLQESTYALMHGRTTLLIAHRLATVHRADLIIVLAGGRVVESGAHAALMQTGGLYRRLVSAPTFAAAP